MAQYFYILLRYYNVILYFGMYFGMYRGMYRGVYFGMYTKSNRKKLTPKIIL